MAYPIKDCSCEDFPCCEHADNYPSEPEFCDDCGFAHRSIDCPTGYEENVDDEEEDEAPYACCECCEDEPCDPPNTHPWPCDLCD